MFMRCEMREIQNKELWESFLLSHSPASLFQSWPWGEVQRRQGICVWRYGVFEEGRLSGIVQVSKICAKRGWFLHVRHGPIIGHSQSHLWQFVMDWLADKARKERCWFVRINPLVEDNSFYRTLFSSLCLLRAAIHAMDGEYCWVLDLDRSTDEILADMRKSTRYEIRRSEKMAIEVVRSDKAKDLAWFMSLYKKTSLRHEFVPHQGIGEEFSIFARNGQAQLYLARFGGEVLAGALILWYGDQAIYHHGASVTSRVPASYAIQWQAILDAKKRGIKLYNFWGIAPEDNINHPWRGITLFKKGFGGRISEYIHAHDLPVSPFYQLSRGVETIRRIRKGY
ncbi:peptidoglycan bridge formation glycyltransferase FemA/FemB family protein [Candidatus Gottesmanbacteria bacterium]|nr:peptidoglycan bridge formation glycyltransferase FemA/FemB family protein [Candidatus Gottesmanbacteria bacterium]